jgi:molecular chaperone HscB
MQTTEPISVSAACWSCGQSLQGAVALCAACGKVQPAAPHTDYFTVFGLSRRLDLDTAALERAFYRLSRKLHPDVYARAAAEEQQWSLDQTSLLNDAYRTLKNPVSRTEYLLKLEGKPIASEEQADGPKDSRVPADMLEEVFELNMQLEEMRMNRKMGEDDPALRGDLERAKAQFEAQLKANDDELKTLWQQWDEAVAANTASSAERVKDQMFALLDRRRYLRNLVRDVNETLEA